MVGDLAVPAAVACRKHQAATDRPLTAVVIAMRVECLAYAIDASIVDGIWGGLTPSERRKLLERGEQPSPAHRAAGSRRSSPVREALEFPAGCTR